MKPLAALVEAIAGHGENHTFDGHGFSDVAFSHMRLVDSNQAYCMASGTPRTECVCVCPRGNSWMGTFVAVVL